MKKQPKISVCMIVKDEEKLLDSCLSSVSSFAYEIIVVDTGSTDGTIDIAKTYSAKTYFYQWDNNFSNARNFSISKASGDWILLMDADERLVQEDIKKLLDFVKKTDMDGAHFKVYNYVGQGNGTNYTLHNALRLLRNNGKYQFSGDIHEQIIRLDGQETRDKFAILDVRINHLGYLDQVVKDKDKRARNIPILLKQLEEEPDNAFILFNLGNEYVAQNDFAKALSIYQKALNTVDVTGAYAPHLVFRTAMCLYNLKQYQKAIEMLDNGLKLYPLCTDMEYLKGLIFTDYNRYTLAIESFNKALEMGEAPSTLNFSDFCGSTKPLLALGRLYLKLHDYKKALEYLTKLINLDNSLYFVLYYVGEALNKLYADKQLALAQLVSYFSSLEHLPNLIILTDILIEQQLYDAASKYIDLMQDMNGNVIEKKLLAAKLDFYTGNYEKAAALFYEIAICEPAFSSILPNAIRSSTLYLFIAELLYAPEKAKDTLSLISANCEINAFKVYTQAYNVFFGIEEKALPENSEAESLLTIFSEMLNVVIKTKEFDLFEKLLHVYNYMDTDKVLLSLAQVYYDNGYYEFAKRTVISSINQLNAIDNKGVDILYSSFFEC